MKANLVTTWIAAGCVAAMAALTGCTPATAPTEPAAAPAAPVAPAATPVTPVPAPTPAPAPAPAPAPVPAPAEPVERTGPLLLNTSFEVKDEDGVPNHWNVSDPLILAPGAEAHDGAHVLALTGGEEDWGTVAQPVNIVPGDLGATLTLKAMTIAPVDGQLTLDVLYKVDGENEVVNVFVPAGDEWTEVTVEAPLPSNADPKSVRARIGIRPGAKGKYLVDAVSASVAR